MERRKTEHNKKTLKNETKSVKKWNFIDMVE